ncbi:MAG: universal stress protein [Bacteroidetes bacterium]|jgi:nucleotide-binding universal stress UspA family protein|nr:universal stress protein [Bacteroidota bacterium]
MTSFVYDVRIMIASDLSENSLLMMEQGIKLARQLNGAVWIIHVVDNTLQYSNYVPTLPKVWNWEEVEQYAIEFLTKGTQKYSDVDKEIVIRVGDPKKEIIEQAAKLDISYLVIGTHGKTGLSHWVMGSNAEYLIRHATVPVIVIPYRRETH